MVYCSRKKDCIKNKLRHKAELESIICFYGNYKRKYHSILSVKINYILKMVHFHLLFSTFHIKHSTRYFFPLRSFVYFKVLFFSALHSILYIHIYSFLWKHSQQIHGLPYCLPFLLFNYIIIVIMLIAVAYIFFLSLSRSLHFLLVFGRKD